MRKSLACLSCAAFLLAAGSLAAENWPQWRGPNGDGTSPERGLSVEWSTTKNVVWKLDLPGPAGSTPAVWGDRIFLTSADDKDLVVLCVSAAGKELWKKKLGTGNRMVRGDEGNSASASPVTDGKNVWAFVGSGDLACYDFDGNEKWKASLPERHGKYRIQFGMTSTPVLHEDTLYFMCIHSGDSYLLAIDKATGKDRWKHLRKTDARQECEHSYASPILYRDAERTLLLAHGGDYLTAHRIEDGAEVWRCGALNPKDNYNETLRLIASPVCRPGLVVIPSAKNGPVLGLRPDGKGDVTVSHRAWTRAKETTDVPTPAIHDGLVYLLRENGVLICMEADTGKEVYLQRTHPQRHRASPIVADGKVYCAAADGMVTVVQAGRNFKVLASNNMDDHLSATPAVSGGKIYLRTYKALWAIQAPAKGGDESGGR